MSSSLMMSALVVSLPFTHTSPEDCLSLFRITYIIREIQGGAVSGLHGEIRRGRRSTKAAVQAHLPQRLHHSLVHTINTEPLLSMIITLHLGSRSTTHARFAAFGYPRWMRSMSLLHVETCMVEPIIETTTTTTATRMMSTSRLICSPTCPCTCSHFAWQLNSHFLQLP